ncbi:type 1 periplasmic binding fold superfamily protein [Flagellimonas hymeniacidonis]|uniref:Type 1 periplasmic binding fold superfamily protein n=1 Tax=Flagellimonas hymeniacidonis TaxID=2603628 RepID=A0A5C8V2Q8_9FLAO|nr:type 1 periplasmic binding fold superfamily protein [Flagellimonas hymeniacidonis]TXN35824.1 type 1 periplasmic binding fold superfamily protein [Flagellimonas hymeniacidonis]
MKTTKFLSLALLTGTFLVGCSSDDNEPDPVNEEETITTMNVTLTPQGGGTTITLQSQDLDGDGPNAPNISISGDLAENTVYDGIVVLLNEAETPAENVNEEIEGEADEHQFFFVPNSSLNATIAYTDDESDYVSDETGENFTSTNPVGISFTLTTTDASTGTLAITLRHEPKKPNDGTLADAGGETDITQAFNLVIE